MVQALSYRDVRDLQVSEGVQGPIEQLYREDGDRLWRAVLFFGGDREVASDAVAEAFARALERADTIRDLRAWVWRVSFRLAARELRRRRIWATASRDASYEIPEAGVLLATVMPQLSPRQRACVVLHYYAGHSQKDVATILRTSPSAVGVHLHRARARIREALEDHDGE